MISSSHKPQTIDEYMAPFPPELKLLLQKVRKTIAETAPEAVEAMSYGIPTFKLHGNLVHFGGYATHIGFYPGSEAIEVFQPELKDYECSKGTIRFPLDKPIPYDLVKKIVEYRVRANTARGKNKK